MKIKGPRKGRSPGSAETFLRLIWAPISHEGAPSVPAVRSSVSLQFSAILSLILSPRPGPRAQKRGRLSHLSPGMFCYHHHDHLVSIYYAAGTMLSMSLELTP